MNQLIKISNGPYSEVSMNIYIHFSGLYTKSAKKYLSTDFMCLSHLK